MRRPGSIRGQMPLALLSLTIGELLVMAVAVISLEWHLSEHDLRADVDMLSEVLAQNLRAPLAFDDSYAAVEAMIERALRLCEYKSARAILQLRALDLGEALATAMTSHADRIAQKQLRVHQKAQAEFEVDADPTEVQSALSAMLARAIDASLRGGTIDIGWRTCTDWVEVQMRGRGTCSRRELAAPSLRGLLRPLPRQPHR